MRIRPTNKRFQVPILAYRRASVLFCAESAKKAEKGEKWLLIDMRKNDIINNTYDYL